MLPLERLRKEVKTPNWILAAILLFQPTSKGLLDNIPPLKHLEQEHMIHKLTHEDCLHEYTWVWGTYETEIPQRLVLFS